jgi:hypothetical protein
MSKDKVISLENPERNADLLTGLLRSCDLAVLLGKDAKGLSARTISRFKQGWAN